MYVRMMPGLPDAKPIVAKDRRRTNSTARVFVTSRGQTSTQPTDGYITYAPRATSVM